MAWEVDWTHPENTGDAVWARNPTGHLASARTWHRVTTGHLRKAGIATPCYRTDSWEVDWTRRDGKRVLARNQASKMPTAREWHWVDQSLIQRAGLRWRPKSDPKGRRVDSNGYVVLTRRGMSHDDVGLAERFNLFRGKKRSFVREHHLVAVKKYGSPLDGLVVRHTNGVKDDNRPENILIGTTQENTMDHDSARRQAMYWHCRCLELEAELAVRATPATVKDGRALSAIERVLRP